MDHANGLFLGPNVLDRQVDSLAGGLYRPFDSRALNVIGPEGPWGRRALWALSWLGTSNVFGFERPWGKWASWAQREPSRPEADLKVIDVL